MALENTDLNFDSKDIETVVEEEPYQEIIPLDSKPDAVGAKVWQIFEEIVEDKQNQGLHDRWVRNYELGHNKHWKYGTKNVPLISGNLLYIHRQRTVNHLTDNHPTFNLRPAGRIEDFDKEKLEAWDHATMHWWNETEQQSILADSIWNGETYGSAIEWVPFNPELEMGFGEAETLTIDPFYFGVYPVRERDNQKALINMVFMPMHLQEAKRKWPDFADKIRTDGDILAEMGDDRHEISSGSPKGKARSISIGGVISRLLGFSKESEGGLDQMCMIVYCYVKDYTRVKATFPDRPNEVHSAPKYTGHIRQIVVCNQGGLVLEDKDNPNINPNLDPEDQQKTYLYDRFPFTKVNSLQETTQAWGPSDFEQLEALNMELNKSMSQFNAARDKSARSKVINPKTSGVPNEHITNYVGILNPNSANHGISYLEGQPINKDSMLAVDLYKQLFFLVSGDFELDEAGRKGQNVIAYKAIAALLERVAVMNRGKIRSYGKLIRERGRMYLSHGMNFYSEERWISFEENGETKQMPLKGTDMILPLKLMVVSGSTMPTSKVQQRDEALALAKMNRIDQQALLEAMDYPDRRNIIKRMQMGPIGMFLQKLKAIMPPQFMQLFAQIAQMEPDDFKKALEKGEIKPIQLPGQQPTAEQVAAYMDLKIKEAEMKKNMAEADKKKAEADTERAEKALKAEQIVTERVKQRVAMGGLKLDEEKLKLERAQVLAQLEKDDAEIEGTNIDRANKTIETGLKYHKDMAQGGAYQEKGMKSNNLANLE